MKLIVKAIIGVVLTLAIIIGVSVSSYTTTNGQTAMISNLGSLEDPVTAPGLHWKNPFTESVAYYNTQLHSVNYGGAVMSSHNATDDSGIMTEADLAVMDAKNVGYNIEMTIQYTPDVTQFKQTLTKYGANYYDKLINPEVYDIVRDVGSHYAVDTIADHRAEITIELKSRLSSIFKNYPVTLNDVTLRGITLPPSITDRILATQQAQQEVNKLVNQEKIAEEQRSIDIVKADALRQQAVLQAQGVAQATLLQKEAEAKGNHELASSLTQTLVDYIRAKQWDGALPQISSGAGGGFMFQMPVPTRGRTVAPAASTGN